MFVVELDGADRGRAASAVDHVVARSGGLAAAFEGQLVLLLPDTDSDPAATARALADELGHSIGRPVTVGGAGPRSGVGPLSDAHGGGGPVRVGPRSLGRGGQGASLAELGFVGLVLGDRPDMASFVAGCLGPLLEYDDRRGTDLIETLQAYFDAGGHAGRTKDVLHVRRATVAERLRPDREADRDGLAGLARQLELQAALRLYRISARPLTGRLNPFDTGLSHTISGWSVAGIDMSSRDRRH